jgi:sugar transferase (PEP-CTERM/EpsH1 system associated)
VNASRPKLLCLVHRVPYPPNRGDRIRSFHLLKFLADLAELHLAFLSEGPPDPETLKVLECYCERVAAVPLGRAARWLSAAWSLGVGRTATEGLFRSARLKRTVCRWARENRFHAVVAVCSSMVQYLDLAELNGVPVIIDLVDVDSEKWSEYARHSRGLRRRIFQLEGRRLRRLEASLPDRAEAITFVSPEEAELFRSFCPTDRVHAIPNGVDLDYFRPDAGSGAPVSPHCVFVGALDYQANLDGVAWFCREIWPAVRRRHPEATFRLVGSRPGFAARRLARTPGVELVGGVPDVRPYLGAAAVAVVPLRVARGLQNKVLEAMAMGKPVVATPQALEGVGATSGVHLCQAATPDQWVQALSDLLSDCDLRSRLGDAARVLVAERFEWEAQLQPLAALLGLSVSLHQAPCEPSEHLAV